MRTILTAIAFVLAASTHAAATEIDHVEPMNWWIGMKDPHLQIMVHGAGIADMAASLHYPGVELIDTEHTDNRNYLFLNLLIHPDAQPGTFPIVFAQAGAAKASLQYRLEARRSGSAERRGFDASDSVYLLMPDRFANGDPGNDDMPGMLDKANRSDSDGRHGGDLRGMEAHLGYIHDLGFTMIWPTPLLENNESRYSYHGYAQTDLYRVDSRFGSNEDYRRYAAAANELGMGVIHDIVLNHIGINHWWMRDLPAADWVHSPKNIIYTNHLHSAIQDIHAAPEERARFTDGWFDDHMPDLNQRNPLLARYLIQNSIWWIEYANLSGIREDTFSYADKTFLRHWCDAVIAEYPHLNIVGEEMQEEPYRVAYWQKGALNQDGYDSGLPSLMDFPVVDLLPQVLNAEEGHGQGWMRLYEMISADYLYANPMNLMVFPDNHDRSRIFSLLHEDIDHVKTALLFDATTRGIPQMFYGTEIFIPSPIERNDGVLRADMPGGWAGDKSSAFTGVGMSPAQLDMQNFVRKLFNWRKTSHAVQAGKLLHYRPENGCYVYFRYDGAHTVMVVLNKNTQDSVLDLARFKPMIKNITRAHDVLADRTVDLTAPLVLKAKTSAVLEW